MIRPLLPPPPPPADVDAVESLLQQPGVALSDDARERSLHALLDEVRRGEQPRLVPVAAEHIA